MTTIAVLEFKNTRVLHPGDFWPAMASDPDSARAKRDGAMFHDNKTYFVRNACWISKQAKKYFRTTGAPDVAIFDWSAMFIFDFSQMNEDVPYPALARGMWFSEANGQSHQGRTFRTVLLRFIDRALRRHNIIP